MPCRISAWKLRASGASRDAFGPVPCPLALATYITPLRISSEVGNQPTGRWPSTSRDDGSITATALMPASATYNNPLDGSIAMPMGITPRSPSRPGMRRAISPATSLVLRSMIVTVSLWPFETKTNCSVARIPDGLLPPLVFPPNGRPVRIIFSARASSGFVRLMMVTEFDSGTFGSPSPGTWTSPCSVWRVTPSLDSFEGKPKAGKGSPVSLARRGSAPGTGL